MAGEITKIRLGCTDGMRFVGIKPPFSDTELDQLSNLGLNQRGKVEQIMGPNACSLVRHGGGGEGGNVAVRELAGQIADVLATTRAAVDLDVTQMTQLQGADSSPFQPVTG